MSPQLLIWLTAFASGLGGSLVGFWFGFRAGRKWGEADGVAWATERLRQQNLEMGKR